MTRDELWHLYDSVVEQQHRFMTLQQDRSVFNWGLVSAIITATVLALARADWASASTYFGVFAMSVLLAVVSNHAVIATTSADRRFFETTAIRALVEQDLGLASQPSARTQSARTWWKAESYATARMLTNQSSAESSAEYVDRLLCNPKGYTNSRIFRQFRFLSLLVAGFSIALALLLLAGVLPV